MLGLSHYDSVNSAAAMRYRLEFGKDNIFLIRTEGTKKLPERMVSQSQWTGELLFAEKTTYAELAAQLRMGGQVKVTRITEEFSFQTFVRSNGDQVILLFAMDSDNRLHWFTEERQPQPGAGWQITYLLKAASRI
jgi:hypothetical protein